MSGILRVGLVVTAMTVPASAYNFGSQYGCGTVCSGVYITNNYNFSVAKYALTANSETQVAAALDDFEDDTGGFVTSANTATDCWSDSADGTYDACVLDADYGDNDAWGWNSCAPAYNGWGGAVQSGSHPWVECSLNWTRFNTYYGAATQGLACHELGHAIGLRHTGSTSCMTPPPDQNTLSSHDRNHVAFY